MKNLKVKSVFTFFVSILLGAIIFISFYKTHVLNPFYVDWIIAHSGDIFSHWLGWLFYSREPFDSSIFLFDSLTYPVKISIMFTDSIPIVAFIFKILIKVFNITREIQYFGIYVLFNFILQSFFGTLISKKILKNSFLALLAGSLFVLVPLFFQWNFEFPALWSHWYILAAICLFIYKIPFKKLAIYWCLIAFLSCGTHLYLTAMIGIAMLIFYIVRVVQKIDDKKYFLLPLVYGISAICACFLFGGFSSKIVYMSYQFDHPNLSYFALFSKNYIGLALPLIMALCALFCGKKIFSINYRKSAPFFIIFLFLYIIAVIPGESPIFNCYFFKIFRFNERFIFIPVYLLISFLLYLISVQKKFLLKLIIILLAICFQIYSIVDVFGLKISFFERVRKTDGIIELELDSKFNLENKIILSFLSCDNFPYKFKNKNNHVDHDLMFLFGYWAYRYEFKLTNFFLARYPKQNEDYMGEKLKTASEVDLFLFKDSDKENMRKVTCAKFQQIELHSRIKDQSEIFTFCQK